MGMGRSIRTRDHSLGMGEGMGISADQHYKGVYCLSIISITWGVGFPIST